MKNNKGITIVSLVITIIVMVILLTIITTITVDDDLILKTKNATNKINNQTSEERNQDDYLIRRWDELENT